MPIPVTCPGCLKRFQVNEKFAGKTGPCPNCSKPITIPAASEQVVIHAPADSAPKDSKGRPIFVPIKRQEVKISLPMALTVAGISVVSLIVALGVRLTSPEPPTAILALGTMLLAPPLVLLGYWFLRDDELDGFHGKELIARTAIVSAIFMITWALYATIPMYVGSYKTMAEIDLVSVALILPVMVVIGATASVLTMELETLQGVLHYLLYFVITLGLALIMGAQLAEPFARSVPNKPGSTTTAAPASPAPAAATPAPPTPPNNNSKAKAPTPPKPDPNSPKSRLMQ